MNSLEFIGLEIARAKSKYKEHIKFGQTAFAIKDEKRLQTLYQIKSELEAWEVVKWSISKKHLEDFQIRTMYGENSFMNISKKDYDVVKQALEVKDE